MIHMKNILTLITFILFSFGLFAQTSLDFLLFKKINDYRNSNLMELGDCTHFQVGSDSTYSGGDRLLLENVLWGLTKENCAVTDRYNYETDEEQSEKILQQWINSPGHHRTLLCPNTKYGAVSTTHTSKFQWSIGAWWTYSTLNVYS